jgi:hypothetical protein
MSIGYEAFPSISQAVWQRVFKRLAMPLKTPGRGRVTECVNPLRQICGWKETIRIH